MVEDPLLFWDSSFGLTMYSYHLATTIVLLAVLRVIHGVTWAVSTTAVGTAITDIIPDSRRGEGMGWYGMAMTIAMAIGPMIDYRLYKIIHFTAFSY